MDLSELVAAERWDALDDFIQGFPANSHMHAAMVNDPEYADKIAEQQDPNAKWHPSYVEYDLQATMMARLIAAVDAVQSAVISAAGGTPPPNKQFPRPVTEVDAARDRLEKRAASAILEMAGFDPSKYL